MSWIHQNRYLLGFLFAAISVQAVLPMRDQWRAGCEALGTGDPQGALVLFREFDHWYANEPAVAEADFRESRIRLWALAALEAGSWEEAADLLERWLTENPDRQRFRAFLRYQLADLHQMLGNGDTAELHREQFLRDHPELPECILIHWNRADEALAREDKAAARSHMAAVIQHPGLPPSGHTLARAALAAIAMAEGDEASALEQLSGSPDDGSAAFLDLWRGLIAPGLAQQLLAADKPGAARSAAAWFNSANNLNETLQGFRQSLSGSPAQSGIRQTLWNRRWSAQLNQSKAALEQVSASISGTDALYILRLRILLKSEASRDAAILGRALIESPAQMCPELLPQAYKGTIEACLQLQEWNTAETITRSFLEMYPENPALPDILFMNARTAAARKDWLTALEQVGLLIREYPGNPSSLSWLLMQAGWMLEAGQPQDALAVLQGCSGEIPPSWAPFLSFQMGRCHEAMKELDAAADLFRGVAERTDAAQSLRESAHTALLKLHFRRHDAVAFLADLAIARDRWPEGMNRLLVESLAGSFHQRSGKVSQAIQIFSSVAGESHPAAGFAREQLSSLYRDSHDIAGLRRHALDWISIGLRTEARLPPGPFIDLRYCHQQTGKPSLPDGTLLNLLEAIDAGDRRLPADALLDLVQAEWDSCRRVISSTDGSMETWIEARAIAAKVTGNRAAFAVYQLYAARLFESHGRSDSADARRIEVIRAVPADLLGEMSHFTIARTAHHYDFPEKEELLEAFLSRYPESSNRPDALFLMAGFCRSEGNFADAVSLLREIQSGWPDAAVHNRACLQLAEWHLADNQPEAALVVLDTLLSAPRLPPRMTARALLSRARADFQTGRDERGALNTVRILSLYPNFHDTADSAIGLLSGHLQDVDDSGRRQALVDHLTSTLPQDVLSKIQIPNA